MDYAELLKVNFLDETLVRDYVLALRNLPRVEGDNELIRETPLTFIEEAIKRLLKLVECLRLLNQPSLHFWCDLLVEREFFDQQIKVLLECLLNVEPDIVVKDRLDMEWFVRFFYLF